MAQFDLSGLSKLNRLDQLISDCGECGGQDQSLAGKQCPKCKGDLVILTPAGNVLAEFLKKLKVSPRFQGLFSS